MSQRGRQQRRRRRRRRERRRRRLANWGILAGLVAAFAAVGTLGANLHADGREHESRQAAVTIEDYDELKDSLEPWVAAAKDAYDAAEMQYVQTGRWPRAKELGTHRPVYRAHTKVQNLQDGMSDHHLVRLLDALHEDVSALCAATSSQAANQAAEAMVDHRRKVIARLEALRASQVSQLQVVG